MQNQPNRPSTIPFDVPLHVSRKYQTSRASAEALLQMQWYIDVTEDAVERMPVSVNMRSLVVGSTRGILAHTQAESWFALPSETKSAAPFMQRVAKAPVNKKITATEAQDDTIYVFAENFLTAYKVEQGSEAEEKEGKKEKECVWQLLPHEVTYACSVTESGRILAGRGRSPRALLFSLPLLNVEFSHQEINVRNCFKLMKQGDEVSNAVGVTADSRELCSVKLRPDSSEAEVSQLGVLENSAGIADISCNGDARFCVAYEKNLAFFDSKRGPSIDNASRVILHDTITSFNIVGNRCLSCTKNWHYYLHDLRNMREPIAVVNCKDTFLKALVLDPSCDCIITLHKKYLLSHDVIQQ